jgi:hypothetical protein
MTVEHRGFISQHFSEMRWIGGDLGGATGGERSCGAVRLGICWHGHDLLIGKPTGVTSLYFRRSSTRFGAM